MAGLALKTRVFAAVKATNLDKRYEVFHFSILFFFKFLKSWQKHINQDDTVVYPSVFPTITFTDLDLFFYALPTFITPLCYYSEWRRQSAGQKVWYMLSPMQLDLEAPPHLTIPVPLQVEHLDGLLLLNPLRES